MLSQLHIFGVKTACPHEYNMPGIPLKRLRPFVIYFTGASVQTKCWPEQHFSELIERMSSKYTDHDHLVLEGTLQWGKKYVENVLKPLKNITNTYSIQANTIEDTTALIKSADLLVANDTGIRHVAIVSNTPTVGIFFGDPYRYWPRYDIHEIALPDVDGPPEVNEVYNMCIKIMNGAKPN